MFWGLIMEPGRCYTQTVKVSFHVSMAALDISNSSDEPSQVMCVFEGRNYLLCTLNKKDELQCPLDLNFEAGTKVSFATNGKSHVHLTGYLTTMEDEFGEEEQEEEEEQQIVTKKDKKRLKKELAEGPPKKKTKITQNSISSSVEEVEEETSDSDFDLDKLEEEEDEGEVEEEGEEEESEGEEEEDEASSLSEPESEEEVEQAKPKQNGIAKTNATTKLKKKEKQEKPEKPQPAKKEKPKKQEDKKEQKDQKQQKEQKQQQQPKGKKTVLKGGVIVQDLKEGAGEAAKGGKFVHVYYEGRLKENNKMFDSTTKGPGFSFRVGKGEVIKGWDIGLVGMKVGGKRRIICPPNTAYGPKGSPPVIPPNATLVFDVELKKIS